MKIHHHESQLDGHRYARCGRVAANHPSIAMDDVFEATEPRLRCALCAKDWFPNGQPDWHLKAAQKHLAASRPNAGPKTIIHVNQHIIRANLKTGARDPVLTVKQGKTNTYAHAVEIEGPSTVVYSPDKPLSCGARVWVETRSKVTTR